MKSVWGMGKNEFWVCVPFASPLPHMPPAPTAIFDGQVVGNLSAVDATERIEEWIHHGE